MNTATAQARDQLASDLKAVIEDAEELLKATAGAAGEKINAARARTEETLRSAKSKLADAQSNVIGQAKDAAKATDEYVHEHPWNAVGIAAGVGLLVGLLISSRR
jgi:ElaB/YqjD/DUF883 family membrane-anchored ribosome-binding protein